MAVSGINNYTNVYGGYNKDFANNTQKKHNNVVESEKSDYVKYTNSYTNKTSNNINTSNKSEFESVDDLMSYLSEKYEVVNKGIADISNSYLKDCLKDNEKLNNLYDMLESADIALEDAKENIKGFQSMKVTIDKDGNMEYETSGGSVVFNEAKRARQLASAKTAAEIRIVISLLNKDLSDCKSGTAKGMCDEAEVAKVEAMLKKAQQRMGQVSGSESSESNDSDGSFYINMLM